MGISKDELNHRRVERAVISLKSTLREYLEKNLYCN